MSAPAVEIAASWGTGNDHTVQVYAVPARPRRVLRRRPRPQRWRWRRLAGNALVVATSAEAYTNYEDCRSMALLVNPARDPRSWTGRR